MESHLQFRVLGPVEAEVDGRSVEIGSPLQRALLVLLLMESGRVVSTDTIVASLWGEEPPATAGKSIQKYVSRLRRILPGAIETEHDGYKINVADIDVRQFEDKIGVAKSSANYDAALSLWRGVPYQELVDWPGSQPERTRLEELRLQSLEERFEARLAEGKTQGLVGDLEDLVARYPLRERLWGLLMKTLYRVNRQADALRTYQRLRNTLGDELGIEPSADLQELENKILLQDASLRIDERVAGNIPPPLLTSFVGRKAELSRVDELMADNRLVTLVGPGGSGKSRLALEQSARLSGLFPAGIWMSELASLTSPDQVARALATPLGVGITAERPVEQLLVEYLKGRQVLLVVDNCEHLIDEVARLVDLLLRSSTELRVLATSREPLGLPGEVIFEVLPLGVPETGQTDKQIAAADAVHLLLDRVSEVDQNFALDSENASAVASICRTLDGMPLALELVAAQFRSFAPNEIEILLADRFDLLVKGPRSAPARHHTLRAAVAWSYDLLNEDERRLFRRLSVFRGGFDLEAASIVCLWDVAAGGAALLASLVDKSLVVADHSRGRTRYYLLETLRQYGRELAEPEEIGLVRDRHANHYCELAVQATTPLRGPEQGSWLKRLAAEHDNMLKALRWAFDQHPEIGVRMAVALWSYWDAAGPRFEGQQWLERAIKIADGLDSALYHEALLAASDAFVSSQVNLSVEYAERALTYFQSVGDGVATARAMRALGWAAGLAEQHDRAITLLEEATGRLAGDKWEQALSWERLGQVEYQDPEQSMDHYRHSLDLYHQVGDGRRAALVQYKQAERAAQAHRYIDEAAAWVADSLAVLEDLGTFHDVAHCLLEVGRIARRRGLHDEARQALEQAVERMRRIGDERCTGRALGLLAVVLMEASELDKAAVIARAGMQIGAGLAEKQTIRLSMAALAGVASKKGDLAEAVLLYGATDHLGRTLQLPQSEQTSQLREEQLTALRSAMAPEDYEAAWRRGQSMLLPEAVEYALGYGAPSPLPLHLTGQ